MELSSRELIDQGAHAGGICPSISVKRLGGPETWSLSSLDA